MARKAALFIVSALMLSTAEFALAEELRGLQTQTSRAKPEIAQSKEPARRTATKPDVARQAKAPCAKGTWKDDPVCFGEGDPDILPTPSASGEHVGAKGDLTIEPKMDLNSRSSGAGVVYKHDGNAIRSDYGGGVSVGLPF